MPKLGRADSLAEVIGATFDERMADVHTAVPAKVVEYDATKQQVAVQVLVQTRHEIEDGTEVARTVPVIYGVPLCFPTLGAMGLTFPVPLGSFVLVVFTERSLDRWLAGNGAEVDPDDVRSFHLSDAVAIPGIRPFGAPMANVPTDVVCIHGDVKLGGHDATSFAAKADAVLTALNAIKGAISAPNTTAGAINSAAAALTFDVACTKVKVK